MYEGLRETKKFKLWKLENVAIYTQRHAAFEKLSWQKSINETIGLIVEWMPKYMQA